MAFNIKYFAKVGNQAGRGSAPQYYTYRTTDTAAQVAAYNYFLPVATMLELGDVITVQFVDDLESPGAIGGTVTLGVALKQTGMIMATQNGEGKYTLVARLADVSTASTAPVTSQVAGTITKITGILGGTITTANATVACNIGGAAITDGTLTVTFAASTKGSTFTASPSAANTLTVGNVLNAVTDGGSTGTQPLYIIYEVEA